jgi:hypothetical protein
MERARERESERQARESERETGGIHHARHCDTHARETWHGKVGSDERGSRVGESASKEDAMMVPTTSRTGGRRRGEGRGERERTKNEERRRKIKGPRS